MMTELRRLWYLLYTNDIHIRPRYIRLAANILVDTLSLELDIEDLQLNPRLFAHLQSRWGPHSIDRFASMLNTQLRRFNAIWHDPQCEDVNCLRLPDAARRCGAVRKQILQPPLDCSTNPRRQTAPFRRSRYHRGPLLVLLHDYKTSDPSRQR
jgi:hypothetical protein